jgi:sugar phosphate isomerase/epimerase
VTTEDSTDTRAPTFELDLGRDLGVVHATFNPDSGRFTAPVGGKTARAETWEELRSNARRLAARLKIKVAVEFVDPDSGAHGTATGIHASRQVPLITWADGSKDASEVRWPLAPTTDSATVQRLAARAQEALQELQQYRREHRLPGGTSLSQVVNDAIQKAAQETRP